MLIPCVEVSLTAPRLAQFDPGLFHLALRKQGLSHHIQLFQVETLEDECLYFESEGREALGTEAWHVQQQDLFDKVLACFKQAHQA